MWVSNSSAAAKHTYKSNKQKRRKQAANTKYTTTSHTATQSNIFRLICCCFNCNSLKSILKICPIRVQIISRFLDLLSVRKYCVFGLCIIQIWIWFFFKVVRLFLLKHVVVSVQYGSWRLDGRLGAIDIIIISHRNQHTQSLKVIEMNNNNKRNNN